MELYIVLTQNQDLRSWTFMGPFFESTVDAQNYGMKLGPSTRYRIMKILAEEMTGYGTV